MCISVFELIAENTVIGKQKKQIIKLSNSTFHELYTYFNNLIEAEKSSKQESKEKLDSNSKNSSTKYIQHKTDKGIIEIEPCSRLKGQKAFMNGRPAPDGIYKFGVLWFVEIRDGIVIKG